MEVSLEMVQMDKQIQAVVVVVGLATEVISRMMLQATTVAMVVVVW